MSEQHLTVQKSKVETTLQYMEDSKLETGKVMTSKHDSERWSQ